MRTFIPAFILSLVLFGCSNEKKSAANETQKAPELETIESSPEGTSSDDILKADAQISSQYDSQTLVRLARELLLPTDIPALNQQILGISNKGRYGDCVDFVNLPIYSRLVPQFQSDPILKNIREACGSRFFNPDISFLKTSDRYFEISNLNFGTFGMLEVNLLARDGQITGAEIIDFRMTTASYRKILRAVLSNGSLVSKDDKVENGVVESSKLEVLGSGHNYKLEVTTRGRYYEVSAKLSYHLPASEGSTLEIEDTYYSDSSKKTCRILVKKDNAILFSEYLDNKNCNFTSSSHSLRYL